MLRHGVLEARFRLVSSRRQQCFVVVERDEVEDEVVDFGVRGAQQRLGAARAFLEVKPDDRWLLAAFGGGDETLGG